MLDASPAKGLIPQSEKVRKLLSRLAAAPPQTLLLEGGTEQGRLQAALFWAMLAKCGHAMERREEHAVPCGKCTVCLQIANNENSDLQILDGRISNTQDDEKPGPIRALNIENTRNLKLWATAPPRGPGPRIAIIQGLVPGREEALNGLLKTLEEPPEHALFVLLAPLREQVLPTIVSRSLCLALPWAQGEEPANSMEQELAIFVTTGSGKFVELLGNRGAVDQEYAARALVACQRALTTQNPSPLGQAFAPLMHDREKWTLAASWIRETQTMLLGGVTPGRVVFALLSRLFLLCSRDV